MTFDKDGKSSLGLRTLFAQEMIKNNILMPWIALSYAHGEKELTITQEAMDKAMVTFSKGVKEGYESYLVGEVIKPVFRKIN
jgi:glutamate-1-semialdehyde 2,1-aminomutase